MQPVSLPPVIGLLQTCVRKIRLPSVHVQETEFQWGSSQLLQTNYQAFELYYRIQPYDILAQGWPEGGQKTKVGRLSLYLPGTCYHGYSAAENETVRTIVCRFDRHWIRAVTGTDVNWSEFDAAALLDIREPQINRSMWRIAAELAQPRFNSDRLIEAVCNTIAFDLVRHFTRETSSKGEDTLTLPKSRLKRIDELVRLADGMRITASDIAQELGISSTHLQRVFIKATGQTLQDYLEEARIAKACVLLIETNLPVKVVSFRAGFPQHSSFSYTFKRITGMTPKDFRARKLI